MYRVSTTPCPACSNALVPLTPSPVPAHVCPACGGTWLGPETSIHVMQGLGDAVTVELSAATVGVGRRAPLQAPSDLPDRACPTCASIMMPMTVAGVVVDSCPAHGTWFDRDELGRVASACKNLREGQEVERSEGPPITFEGVIEGTAVVGYGLTKAFVNVIAGIYAAVVRADEREREGERGFRM